MLRCVFAILAGTVALQAELREFTVGVDPDAANPPCEFVSGPFIQASPYYNRQVKVIEKSDRAKVKELMQAAGAVHSCWLKPHHHCNPLLLRLA